MARFWKTVLFARFSPIGLNDALIGQRFLRRIGQILVTLERFARQFAQGPAEAHRQSGNRWRDKQ